MTGGFSRLLVSSLQTRKDGQMNENFEEIWEKMTDEEREAYMNYLRELERTGG
jgi:hypothetical protein